MCFGLLECWRYVRPCCGTPELSGGEKRRCFSFFAHESFSYSEFDSLGGSLTPDRLLSSVILVCHQVKAGSEILQFLYMCSI